MPDPRNKARDMAVADQRRREVQDTLQELMKSIRDHLKEHDPTVVWARETNFVFKTLTEDRHRLLLSELTVEAMLQLIDKEEKNGLS